MGNRFYTMYKIVYSDFGVSVKVDFPPAKLSRKHPTPFGEKLLAPAVAGVLRVSKKLDRFCFYFYLTQYLFGNEVIIPPTFGNSLEITIEDFKRSFLLELARFYKGQPSCSYLTT